MTHRAATSILIVEDERIVAVDLQQTLNGLGYDAFAVASSSDEAVARASARCPDLVLMDIRIKGNRDGIETAEILRRRFGVPVVYLTAHADDATIERAKLTEPGAYLLKPVKSAELRSAIEISLYRHKMEQKSRERERWVSTTLRSIADAIVAVDLMGNVTFMNPAAEVLTGTTFADALGRDVRDILQLVDDDAVRIADAPLAVALRTNGPVELLRAGLVNLSTGGQRIISDSAAPVTDEGKTLGAVMVFRDVTDQTLLQKKLEVSDRLASLGTMAAGVAHEINNPLAVVTTNAEYVAEVIADQQASNAQQGDSEARADELREVSQALQDIQSAASRISRIIADLRVFSRPRKSRPGTIDVTRCIDWAVRATAHEFRHRAQLVTHVHPTPPVSGDEEQLGQVLINLLINAAHAIDPGNAHTNEVSITTSTDDRGWIVVDVTDTGVGIPRELLARIIEPFFTTKPVGSGTGLGLSICQGIVSSLGGELRVESEVGKGSRFTVTLPPARVATPEPRRSAPHPEAWLRGRILVIDDEQAIGSALRRTLGGHEVMCFTDARDALALLDEGALFDVIFTDVMMPMMTGIEFYEILLQRHPTMAARVVFLSGGAITAKVDDFLRTVANPCLEKPFEIRAIATLVQDRLAAHAT